MRGERDIWPVSMRVAAMSRYERKRLERDHERGISRAICLGILIFVGSLALWVASGEAWHWLHSNAHGGRIGK